MFQFTPTRQARGYSCSMAALAASILLGVPNGTSAQPKVKDGVRIEFAVRAGTEAVMEGDFADLEFHLSDAASGQPLRGLRPAAWIDAAGSLSRKDGQPVDCRERVGAYLKGSVANRPLVDLNAHYLLVLNRDPSISVIDPLGGISGRTSLYANVVLRRAGADWAEHPGRRRLFVTMPRADQVAVIDTESFRVIANLNTGREPVRVLAQRLGTLAFVANNGDGTLTVLDAASDRPLTTLRVGAGHHELALAEDASRLYVTNKDARSVSVVDTAHLKVLQTIDVGGVPVAVTYSPLAAAAFVAEGTRGDIVSIPADGGPPRRISLGLPLGGLQATPDGRALLALATEERSVFVIDAADLRVLHRISLPGAPFQVAFTREFAHLRMYDTERVSLLPLNALHRTQAPVLGGYAAGAGAPRRETVTVMATGIAATGDASSAIVVNPADGRLHYYMEGMNATAGSFRNYGHPPQAVRVTDRSLRERSPGRYATRVRLPVAGELQVALLLDQPRTTECFSLSVAANPSMAAMGAPLRIALDSPVTAQGEPGARTLRLRLSDSESGAEADFPEGTRLKLFRAPGTDRRTVPLRRVSAGLYEASVELDKPGAYYLSVDSAAQVSPPFISLHIKP